MSIVHLRFTQIATEYARYRINIYGSDKALFHDKDLFGDMQCIHITSIDHKMGKQ